MYTLYKVITFQGKAEDTIAVDTFESLQKAKDFQVYLIVNGNTMVDNGRLVKWVIKDSKGITY